MLTWPESVTAHAVTCHRPLTSWWPRPWPPGKVNLSICQIMGKSWERGTRWRWAAAARGYRRHRLVQVKTWMFTCLLVYLFTRSDKMEVSSRSEGLPKASPCASQDLNLISWKFESICVKTHFVYSALFTCLHDPTRWRWAHFVVYCFLNLFTRIDDKMEVSSSSSEGLPKASPCASQDLN
jgi:hypothetical protein